MQISDWNRRYREQAGWTRSTRQYLFSHIQLEPGAPLLEVGCGTGAVLSELAANTARYGLDINFEYLALARKVVPATHLTCGDALRLPYADASFAAVYCHFFLMWVDAAAALAEMRRVTRPGGWVLALAEPDYGGRIDYPEELSQIGRLQTEALRWQGAKPETGRRLAGLFHQAGLQDVRAGLIGAEWAGDDSTNMENEWQVIVDDLQGVAEKIELARLRRLDDDAWKKGERVLFVPIFFAWGRKGKLTS